MNKIDLEDVKFSLDNIASTLGPVMEDMEQEHLHSKGLVQNFYARMESVYPPALNLIQCSAFDLLKEVKEATV